MKKFIILILITTNILASESNNRSISSVNEAKARTALGIVFPLFFLIPITKSKPNEDSESKKNQKNKKPVIKD